MADCGRTACHRAPSESYAAVTDPLGGRLGLRAEDLIPILGTVQHADDLYAICGWAVEDQVVDEPRYRPHAQIGKLRILELSPATKARHLNETGKCRLCRAQKPPGGFRVVVCDINGVVVEIAFGLRLNIDDAGHQSIRCVGDVAF